MAKLGCNIDHIATIREARKGVEPDPVWGAAEAELGGADMITVHLREDRRHIHDRDVEILSKTVQVPLNLEMAATDEIIGIALKTKPHMVTLVPEKRTEVTTEGGLDVAGQIKHLTEVVRKFKDAGILASAFIDAEPEQIQAAHKAGFPICEIHTGPYSIAALGAKQQAEFERVAKAGQLIVKLGMQFNAGHGLNYRNVQSIAKLPDICELHIGHAIMSRAMFIGIREAVREMKAAIA